MFKPVAVVVRRQHDGWLWHYDDSHSELLVSVDGYFYRFPPEDVRLSSEPDSERARYIAENLSLKSDKEKLMADNADLTGQLQEIAKEVTDVATTPPGPDRSHLYMEIATRVVALIVALFMWYQAQGHLAKISGAVSRDSSVAPVKTQ